MQESDMKSHRLILASGSARRKEILEAHGITPVIMPMDVDETLPDGIAPQDAVMYLSLKKGLACERALLAKAEVTLDQKNATPLGSTGYQATYPVDRQADRQTDYQTGCDADYQAGCQADRQTDHQTGCDANCSGEHALIISADTMVYAKDITTDEWTIMGKPKDTDDAWRMLKSIVSTRHKVMTGVTLITIGDWPQLIQPLRRVFFDSTDVYVNPMTDEDIQAYIDSGEPFGKAGGYAIQMAFGKNIDHIEGDFENVVGFPYNHMMQELEII